MERTPAKVWVCWLVLWASGVGAGCASSGSAARGQVPVPAEIDQGKLEQRLQAGQLEGWIHAAVPEQGLYVFTWRAPGDFFTNLQWPLISEEAEVVAQLPTLRRHDKVRLEGAFLKSRAPQRHIQVKRLTVLERYESASVEPYHHEVQLPADLPAQGSLVGRVHAVEEGGRVLVIEYRDVVLPVVVGGNPARTVAQGLYRGDKIRLHYVVRRWPQRPTHLGLDPEAQAPLELLWRIASLHEQPADIQGVLVKFPKSPQITLDVYALQITDEDGVTLDYTLVNFEKPELFKALRARLAEAFDAHAAQAVNGRNKLLVPGVQVRARGRFNVVSPSQANPQVLIERLEDLTVTEAP